MTATLEDSLANAWESRPGWGISVDLTPPEILGARRARGIKRIIALGLVLVAVACAGVTLMALDDKSAAQDGYDAAQGRTTELQAGAGEYAEVTMLATVASQIETQLATLMTNDVDFVQLMSLIRAALPPRVQLTNQAILLAPPVPVAPPPAAEPGSAEPSADAPAVPPVAAGPVVIGSVSLAGSGTAIKDLAPFVATLNHVRGVVDVVPTSTVQTEAGMVFTLSMNITDELYSHLYDQVGAP
jgi:hypothetical protein